MREPRMSGETNEWWKSEDTPDRVQQHDEPLDPMASEEFSPVYVTEEGDVLPVDKALTTPPNADSSFVERLEQTGQIVDVDADTDLSSLPPEVEWVRYPDGRIERVGFA